MKNLSVTRQGTLWQMWDGVILYPHPMTCELRGTARRSTRAALAFRFWCARRNLLLG